MSARHECSEHVSRGGSYVSHCQLTGIVERDGKWYCFQHDPERKKAKDVAWRKRFDARCAADDAKWRMEEAEDAVIEAAVEWHRHNVHGASVALAGAVASYNVSKQRYETLKAKADAL